MEGYNTRMDQHEESLFINMSVIQNDINLNSFLEDKEDNRIEHLIKENQDLLESITHLKYEN